jgi:DNA repair protein RadC
MRLYAYEMKRNYIGSVEEEHMHYACSNPETADQVLKTIGIHQDEQENLVVIYLDIKNKVIGFSKVTRGLKDRSHVHPREVFKHAIERGACNIILSHNHPSGDTTPSNQDIEVTKNIVSAGKLLGISCVDHIIVAEDLGVFKSYSIRKNGLCEF